MQQWSMDNHIWILLYKVSIIKNISKAMILGYILTKFPKF